MENVTQDNSLPTQPIQQQSSNVVSTNSPSKSRLKIVIAIFVIVILLSVGGYVIVKNSQSISQNTLSKDFDCGVDLDCFIKAAQSCSPATVSKTYSASQGNLKNKMTYEIKGQELEKCMLVTKIELEGDSGSGKAKELEATGKTKEAIKLFNEEIAKQGEAGISCGFDINELVSAIQDFKNGKNTLNEKISTCNLPQIILQRNNMQRSSDVNTILNSIRQYASDNNGKIPSAITTSEQEISKSQADLCSILVPAYIAGLPTDPIANSNGSINDCKNSYSTGYTIFKDSSTNKITVKAPNAELDEKIELTR